MVNKKLIIAVAIIAAVLIIPLVSPAIAAWIASFNSQTGTYAGMTGTVFTMADGTNWVTTPTTINPAQGWYQRFQVTSDGAAMTVTITWSLNQSTDGGTTWTLVSGGPQVITEVALTGSAGQYIYASEDGTIGSNYDWTNDVVASGAGEYQIYIEVNTV